MENEFWERVREVFADALERPAGERAGFIEARCGDDAELRTRVHALLADYESDVDWLEEPPVNLLAGTDDPLVGRIVGAYRVLERVGEGGMGVVYRAERADGAFERTVALKVVKPGMDTEAVLRRFQAERRILGRLEHPAIARIYDAGVTAEGRPWLAMEYVEGEPLSEHAARRGLSIPRRLKLFLRICDAVEHAHRNLVVHRDIKPSNVLVRHDGELKLLDFGVSKVLEGDPDAEPFMTRTGERPMTRPYAAPEQLRGEPVSTATDIYALGVLLYELLCDRRPFHAETPYALERAILETEPPSPGDFARLDRDLATICLAALRKEPARRYASAAALAADVRRHLAGHPIEARPPSPLYRTRKFVGRNRAAAAVGAVGLIALAGGGFLYTVQITQERDRARHEAERAEEVADLLVGMFEETDPSVAPGRDSIPLVEFLEASEERILRGLEHRPQIQGEMLAVLGRIHQARGRYERGRELMRAAIEIERRRAGPDSPELARSIQRLGVLERGSGNLAEAERLLRDALGRLRRHHGDDHPEVARTMTDLASLLPPGDAEKRSLLEEGLAIRRRIFGAEHAEIAHSLQHLAEDARGRHETDRSVELGERALAVAQRTLGPDHPRTLAILNDLAVYYAQQNRPDRVEAIHLRVLATRRRVLGPETMEVANSLNNLAVFYALQRDLPKADARFREALAIQREIGGDDHWMTMNTSRNVGRVLQLQGRFEEALPFFEFAVAGAERGDDPASIAGYRAVLARLLVDLERAEEALPLLRSSLGLLPDPRPGVETSARTNMLYTYGVALLELGRAAEAVPHLREVLAEQIRTLGEEAPQVPQARAALGRALVASGHGEDGARLIQAALPGLEAWPLADPLDLARAREALAAVGGGPP